MEDICRESEGFAYATIHLMPSNPADFKLDFGAHQLTQANKVIKLEPIPMALLFLLVQRKEQLVSRDEIIEKLWGKDRFLDVDNSINTAIRKLRRAFQDDSECPAFIQTLSGKGYRFIGPITTVDGAKDLPIRRVMLAVLPFDNLSGDPKQEYFCDGLTEETISYLGQINPQHLGLIARTSTMAYKRTTKSIAEIGRELSVDYVLESSVRREGRLARITSQLILVRDQTHLWAGTFERDVTRLLEVQAELGRAISSEVQIRLDPEAAFKKQHTPAIEAYDLCLLGKQNFARFNHPEGVECFQQAIEKDPAYAPSFAGLANGYFGLTLARDEPTLNLLPMALAAAKRSLELDENFADGHNALGQIRMWFEWDWPGAAKAFERAIELNSSCVHAHLNRGHLLSNLGRHREGFEEIEIARQLDPLSPMVYVFAGIFLYHARQYDRAAIELGNALALNHHLWLPHLFLGKVWERKGMVPQAMGAFQKSFDLVGGNTELISLKGYIHAKQDNRTEAEQAIQLLSDLAMRQYVPPYNIALVHAGLGHVEQALDLLENAFASRDARALFLAVESKWDFMRGHPRFQDLLRAMNLPCSVIDW